MTFHGMLYERPSDASAGQETGAPDCFVDLNLDQIVAAATAGYREYDLEPIFHTPLTDAGTVRYRQEIMQDLEQEDLLAPIKRFAAGMRAMREHLARAGKLYYKYQKEGWLLDAAAIYCDAVETLAQDLLDADLRSRGFLAFRRYLVEYTRSDRFTTLAAETRQLKAELAAVRYCLLIKGSSIRARRYDGEPDYSAEIEGIFDRFKQGTVKSHLVELPTSDDMNHVEAAVLELVAKLYPELFQRLDVFCSEHVDNVDPVVRSFDREIHFYVAYLAYIAPLRQAGLPFCYPTVSATDKEVRSRDGFDLALAKKLTAESGRIVCNDFHLNGRERILVVSGPNQGGKTTFARSFGQLHYLARLGCPVPGREARLFLCDRLFTHFEREESIATLRGKLEDDLVRIHRILREATPRSIVILNEIFNSTMLHDAIFLSRAIMAELVRLDLLGVWVTFIEELASASGKAVSLVSTIVPGDPASRTYRIIRKPADGVSYAMVLAEKHRLTYDRIGERLAS
ncbi:MutS-related protein [Benzoatithermus flavus]